MHRLNVLLGGSVSLALAILACTPAEVPEGRGKHPKPDAATEGEGALAEGRAEAAAEDGGAEAPPEKKNTCRGFAITNLEDMLGKSDCEVEGAKPDLIENPDMKGKLEVAVTASPAKVAPGGKVDLMIEFKNKTKGPLALNFRIDPIARFETEVYDAKKKRADLPGTPPPPAPKGHSAPPAGEAKVARVIVEPNGYARARVPWEAVKMKWAPEKVRGTAVERGYPRVPNGPLAKGKYTVRVMSPLVGVFEGTDHEVSGPKVEIEVEK